MSSSAGSTGIWHGRIMAALSDNFVRRMRNWAAGKAVGSSKGFAQMRWDDSPGRGSCWHEAPLPVLTGEADDTDAALQAVDIRYRRAVMLFWVWERAELSTLARRCGGIDVRTYRDRVMRGHELLSDELMRRSTQWRTVTDRNRQRATREGTHYRLSLDTGFFAGVGCESK